MFSFKKSRDKKEEQEKKLVGNVFYICNLNCEGKWYICVNENLSNSEKRHQMQMSEVYAEMYDDGTVKLIKNRFTGIKKITFHSLSDVKFYIEGLQNFNGIQNMNEAELLKYKMEL